MSSNWPNPPSSAFSTNKVFINPNFNKCKLPAQQNSTMYINPNFTHHMPQHILINTSKTKIHVNPNFVKVGNVFTNTMNTQIVQNIQVQNIQLSNVENKTDCNLECKQGSSKPCFSTPIQKSRYCLVRNVNKKVIETDSSSRPINTIKKISKYKLVAISDKQKHISTEPKLLKIKLAPSASQNILKNRRNSLSTSLRSKFKYVKRGLTVPVTPIANNNKALLKHKRVGRPSLKPKIKIAPGSLKKNNIPCPLFRKYGKCLRKLHGQCEFLHDKKHVSICRKFLKGVCHDSNCLLSHDLTDKKMPTCRFYLNGMCTKENCPYLHIKLNEKTKVCSDFSKGYCEKGDQCLKRHVNLRHDVSKKRYQPQKNKVKRDQKYKTGNVSKKSIKKVEKSNETKEEESRYYKVEENVNNESNEVSDQSIKPSRCKLGTLPSYIKL